MQNSTSTSGRRLAAAMFLGTASAAMVAGTAHADGGVTGAKVDQDYRDQGKVQLSNHPDANTALIGLIAPKAKNELWTYCIQPKVELQPDQKYDEQGWDSDLKLGIDPQHLEGIKWILNNSFPAKTDLDALAKSAGITGTISEEEAVEGTQAAIWNFSDASGKTKLDSSEGDAKVVKLYNWLTQQAGLNMSGTGQPPASLAITPGSAGQAHPGDKVAFKLTSGDTADTFISVSLSDGGASGAKLVDADGKAIAAGTMFNSGTTVYVQLPSGATSTGSVTLKASGTVSGIEAGRVFIGEENQTNPTQNLILAQSLSTPVSATASVRWQPATTPPSSPPSSSPSTPPSSAPSTPASSAPSTPPTTPAASSSTPGSPNLAHTGAGNTMAIGGGALALVAVGGGVVVYTRRMKKQSSHS